ncbi:MAG: NfeD family protein [Bacteroidales bacterium]
MPLYIIVLFIILGVILLWVEFLVVPGITIAGIGGVLLIGTGIFFSYNIYGPSVGNYVLLGSVLFMFLSVYFSLKSKTWKRTMLDFQLEGRVNTFDVTTIQAGDTGKAVTRLAPIGKVEVNGVYYDAKSDDNIINANTDITVVKILSDKLIVKPTNLS